MDYFSKYLPNGCPASPEALFQSGFLQSIMEFCSFQHALQHIHLCLTCSFAVYISLITMQLFSVSWYEKTGQMLCCITWQGKKYHQETGSPAASFKHNATIFLANKLYFLFKWPSRRDCSIAHRRKDTAASHSGHQIQIKLLCNWNSTGKAGKTKLKVNKPLM